MRYLLGFLLLIATSAAGAWFWAGRQPGPAIAIRGPQRFVGQASSLDLMLDTPGGRVSVVSAVVEQGGRSHPVFALDGESQPQGSGSNATRLYVSRPLGVRAIPSLSSGAARLVVSASRPVLFGWRHANTTVTREIEVRLDAPQVAILSSGHTISQGGTELVLFTAMPSDVEATVHVGTLVYRSYPGTAVGVTDPGSRVAFVALGHDHALDTPIVIVARDPAGNETRRPVPHTTQAKAFGTSRIPIDEGFLQRVVPPILEQTPEVAASTSPNGLLDAFLTVNRDLRRRNAETIAALAASSANEMMWTGAFTPLARSAVEARFADARTYVFAGREVDRQTHLGFDLASTARAPVAAAQRGIVAHAAFLGIYGNCVVIDHGLGVQSLYGHLSSIDVKVGDSVAAGKVLGRSGTTGLAAGDHLHFTVLVGGQPVNATEWWDPRWMETRITSRLVEARAMRKTP